MEDTKHGLTSPPRRFTREDAAWLSAAATALVCILLLSIWNWRSVETANVRQLGVRHVVGELRLLQIRMNEAETGQRGYLLTGDSRYLAPYRKAVRTLAPALARLQTDLTSRGFAAQNQQIQALVTDKFEELDKTVQLRKTAGLSPALSVMQTHRGLHDMEQASQLVEDLQTRLLRNADSLSNTVESRTQSAAIVTSAACILLFALCAVSNLQLRRQRENANEANRAKSAFLATMSHELRTPLNAIIGYSEMLAEEAEDYSSPELISDLSKIQLAGKHLLMLINSILDLSKVESGKMELFVETFGVSTLIDDVVAVIQPLAQKNHNHLKVVVAPEIGVIQTDQVKLRQSLYNLLSNAAKFTRGGTITLTVNPEQWKDGRHGIAVAVTDTGIGLTKEQIQRIFEPFTQADQSTSRRFGGTGLGLALTRNFVQLLGGEISVDSQPQRGSTFTIRIPNTVRSHEPVRGSIVREPVAAAGETILLAVDDDASIHELLTRALARSGFRVVSAYSGEEGIRLARKLRPVAITLDVMMPGMDGWSTLSVLKADPELSEIPVIMLTITDNKNLGYILGATDYLMKPLDREKLVATLMRYRPSLSASSVLLVEDDADTRSLLRRALESEGWKISEAANGREALEHLQESLPGVIVLDLMMPEMDGFQFVAQLRTRPEAKSIPVVVLTAKDLTEEDRERLNGGVTKVIQKGALPIEDVLREISALVTARVQSRTLPLPVSHPSLN